MLEVAARQLHRLGRPVGGDDEELAAPVPDPALAVELEEEPREATRPALLLVLLLVLGVAHAGGEPDAGPVGGPGRLKVEPRVIGQDGTPAAIPIHDGDFALQ